MGNKVVFCITSLLILSCILVSVFSIQPLKAAQKTILIDRNGSLKDPTGMIRKMGNVYIFSGDILDASITVQASNIVIHGSNYKLGAAVCMITEPGILVQNHSVTIMNLTIDRFYNVSIYLDGAGGARNCNISMCHIKTPSHMKSKGILLSHSSSNYISRNVLIENSYGSINLDSSSDNVIFENNITRSTIGINVSDSSNNRIYGNGVIDNDIGIGLYKSSNNHLYGNDIIDNDSGVGLYNSSNNQIYGNNTIAMNNIGIRLEYSSNNQIFGNNITDQNGKRNRVGVHLYYSSGNNVSENSIMRCDTNGVELWYSSNNNVSGNTLYENHNNGVYLFNSSGNTVSENTKITGNTANGISLEKSSNNYICRNMEIADNSNGVYLSFSSGNTISENTVISSKNTGVSLLNSSGNTISGNTIANNEIIGISLRNNTLNNFIYQNDLVNKKNVYTVGSVNIWHNGALNQAGMRESIEGNYWVNYTGADADGDGIGDMPLVIDNYNKDDCPLITPKRPIPFFWNAARYDCHFRANVTVSMLDFNHASASINFDINLAASGYCNITFPSDDRPRINLQLLKGRLKVLIANTPIAYILNWNETHTSICFNVSIHQFDEDPPYKVSVQGEIATPLVGDINMDCYVDIFDVVLVAGDFGKVS